MYAELRYQPRVRLSWSVGRRKSRRGVTVILGLILMSVLVGMVAFSVDIGFLASSKAELRRTADSAALAGGWQLLDSIVAGQTSTQAATAMRTAASQMALQNKVCQQGPELITSGQNADIQEGYLASLSGNTSLSTDSTFPYRAVRVRVQRTSAVNGNVPLYFGRIFGETGREMSVTATAAMARSVKGFNTPSGGNSHIDLLPFALDQATWNTVYHGCGTDNFSFNTITNTLTNGSDGLLEVNLYPQGTGSPGNRGTVDIGGSNNSTADIARQIIEGISSQDLIDLGKPLILDGNGEMTLNGDTGISAGVKDELASIIGQTRVIPIFSSVTGNGNNATYKIVKWVGVRILDVKLTGSMSSKKVIVQPAPVIIRNAVVGDTSRSWSEYVYSPVVLVQ